MKKSGVKERNMKVLIPCKSYVKRLSLISQLVPPIITTNKASKNRFFFEESFKNRIDKAVIRNNADASVLKLHTVSQKAPVIQPDIKLNQVMKKNRTIIKFP